MTASPDPERWPSRPIRRSGELRPLPPSPRSFDTLSFRRIDAPDLPPIALDDFMARRRTMGLVVLKDGEIALERYAPGQGPQRRRTSYSTAKSITSTLVGAALYQGAIQNLDDPCDHYVPGLAGSAYEGVTIRNALRMCSGLAWNEQEDGQADLARLRLVLERRQPGALLELARSLPRAHPQGEVFNYSTVETCVLGAVVAAAVGGPLADFCATALWGPAGMEADGYWVLDGEGGDEFAGAGIGARLRDFARFGLLILEDGVAFGGQRVVGPGWCGLATQPDCPATAFGRLKPGDPGGYGYQWWVVPPTPKSINAGAFSAIGAHGQYIFINPAERVVVAIHSDWPVPEDQDAAVETSSLIRALVTAVS